jgi:hypothetical protein
MTYVTKDGVTILIDTPEGEKKETRYSHPSYVRACRNNENAAALLDYFVYAASREATDKGCKVVTVTRTHKQILQTLMSANCKMSRKSLIRYIDNLNEWKLVLSQPYQRDFTVDLGVIQETLNNPPQVPPRIKHSEGLQEKGGQVTTLQPFEKVDKLQPSNVEELRQKVDKLQQKVDTLQRESGQVTTFCGQVTTLQRDFDALKELVQGLLSGSPIITSNILPVITNKDVVVASHNALTFTLLTEEDFQDIDKQIGSTSQQNAPDPGGVITTQPEGTNHVNTDTHRNSYHSTHPGSLGHSDNTDTHSLLEDHTKAELSTTADERNTQQPTPTDHNALESPAIDEKQPCVEGSGSLTSPTQDKPPVGEHSASESTSSVQVVESSTNQATEQGEQQGNGDSPIATSAIEKPNGRRGKNAGKKEEKPKLEVVKTPPQMPPAEMAWGTRKCMQKFDARRGTLLIGTYAISQASTCAKGLAENYTEGDVDAVTEKMNNDPYWIARGGADICDVARNIHKEIKKIKGQNRPASSPSTSNQPAACMTHDEACKLAHDAVAQAKQHGYDIQAQAVTSKKVEGAWIVKVKWDNADGIPVPPIKTRKQWQEEFQSIHEVLSMQLMPVAERQVK